MVDLLILIGVPGSGKSSLASQWATQWHWERVATDEIRADLYGDEAIQGNWLHIFAEVERRLQQVVLAGKPGAIYDATNTQRRSRRLLIRQARGWGYHRISALWLDVPLSDCIQRNQQRDRQVPLPVLCRMQRQLEGGPPSIREGLDMLLRYRPPSQTP